MNDWLLSKSRREVVGLARAWLNILAEKPANQTETNAQKWKVPQEEVQSAWDIHGGVS